MLASEKKKQFHERKLDWLVQKVGRDLFRIIARWIIKNERMELSTSSLRNPVIVSWSLSNVGRLLGSSSQHSNIIWYLQIEKKKKFQSVVSFPERNLFDWLIFCDSVLVTFADINTMDANCGDNRQKGAIECSVAQLFLLELEISRFEKKNGQT